MVGGEEDYEVVDECLRKENLKGGSVDAGGSVDTGVSVDSGVGSMKRIRPLQPIADSDSDSDYDQMPSMPGATGSKGYGSFTLPPRKPGMVLNLDPISSNFDHEYQNQQINSSSSSRLNNASIGVSSWLTESTDHGDNDKDYHDYENQAVIDDVRRMTLGLSSNSSALPDYGTSVVPALPGYEMSEDCAPDNQRKKSRKYQVPIDSDDEQATFDYENQNVVEEARRLSLMHESTILSSHNDHLKNDPHPSHTQVAEPMVIPAGAEWFVGNVDRNTSEEMLRQDGGADAFVVREKLMPNGEKKYVFSTVVVYGGALKFKHMLIAIGNDGTVAVDGKNRPFTSIESLVDELKEETRHSNQQLPSDSFVDNSRVTFSDIEEAWSVLSRDDLSASAVVHELDKQPAGAFIIRPSRSNPGGYAITIRVRVTGRKSTYAELINFKNGMYHFKTVPSKSFRTVKELIYKFVTDRMLWHTARFPCPLQMP